MCVFDRQGKTELMEDIRRVMPHIKDSDMEELAEQVLGKNEWESVLAKFDTT